MHAMNLIQDEQLTLAIKNGAYTNRQCPIYFTLDFIFNNMLKRGNLQKIQKDVYTEHSQYWTLQDVFGH